MSPDEMAIRELIATWIRESIAGHVDAILPLMADDVVFLGPGRPPMCSRESFAAAAKSAGPGIRMEGSSDIRELEISGRLAYAWSQVTVTLTPPDAPPIKRSGPVLTVFRKNAAGNWELYRDANMLTVEKSP